VSWGARLGYLREEWRTGEGSRRRRWLSGGAAVGTGGRASGHRASWRSSRTEQWPREKSSGTEATELSRSVTLAWCARTHAVGSEQRGVTSDNGGVRTAARSATPLRHGRMRCERCRDQRSAVWRAAPGGVEAPTGGPRCGKQRPTGGTPRQRFYFELKTPPNKYISKEISRS
jgi:hypothetical protein